MKSENRFNEVSALLPPFQELLKNIPYGIKKCASEIRIRAGKPVAVETPCERYYCGTRLASIEEIYECIKIFCNYSIHSCERELAEGWITLKGGHRAGFSGTAHNREGKIETIKDISSLNIRIAREHTGISDILYAETVVKNDFTGLILAGAPLSGKTTMLRDLCRNCGNNHKTALIDERSEIAAVYRGIPQNNVGVNTDILNCYTKKDGIEQAMRVLSPEVLICDEIGQESEIIAKSASSGIRFIVSAHCGSLTEAQKNGSIAALIKSGTANYIAFLDNGKNIGKLKGLWCIENGKGIDSCNDGNNLLCSGHSYFCGA